MADSDLDYAPVETDEDELRRPFGVPRVATPPFFGGPAYDAPPVSTGMSPAYPPDTSKPVDMGRPPVSMPTPSGPNLSGGMPPVITATAPDTTAAPPVASGSPLSPKPLPTAPTYAPPKQKWWQTAADIAGATLGNYAGSRIGSPGLGTRIASRIPGTTENYNRQFGIEKENFGEASKGAVAERERANTESEIGLRGAQAANQRSEAASRANPKVGATPEETTIHDLMTGEGGQPRINPGTQKPYSYLEAYQAVKQAGQDVKPDKFTNPFEAFAYGTAGQKKSAQDFIAFEKQQGARYEKPGEVEQRYALYQKDPEAFKAMYGDRGATQEQTQATRMLNYFGKQRKTIQDDFTLDDAEKQKQLGEIADLEKPYLEIAQPGGTTQGAPRPQTKAAGAGPQKGEVAVISPSGVAGYIPQANLAKALKRGYKQANQ